MNRVMVDIETLGLERDAAIISIGAVEFDTHGLGETFEASINLTSCQDAGLNIDAGTLEWWLEQDDVAREQLTGGDDLGRVLPKFVAWYRQCDAEEVWANSPSFDCEALEYAGDAVGVQMPWQYYEERDYRTLTSLPVAPDAEQDGTEHDALDDAKHQARVAVTTLKRIAETAPSRRDS